MIVVADSSPLIVLINIGAVDILPKLFGQVIIPPQVAEELKHSNRPESVRRFVAAQPDWLIERTPSNVETIAGLHAGENAAINLAREMKAGLLLMDDLDGRRAAADRHIPFTGTIGVLELAADKGLLNLSEAFTKIKTTDFWISHELLDERLRMRELRSRRD